MDSILAQWTWALAPIIDSLETTMSEFVPYVVYVGLWIIGATLGFVAIRWLVNWVRAKVFGAF